MPVSWMELSARINAFSAPETLERDVEPRFAREHQNIRLRRQMHRSLGMLTTLKFDRGLVHRGLVGDERIAGGRRCCR